MTSFAIRHVVADFLFYRFLFTKSSHAYTVSYPNPFILLSLNLFKLFGLVDYPTNQTPY